MKTEGNRRVVRVTRGRKALRIAGMLCARSKQRRRVWLEMLRKQVQATKSPRNERSFVCC